MPRVNIPVTTITSAGVAPPSQTNGDATNNHVMTNDGRTFIEVISSDAGSQTVTIITGQTYQGIALADTTVSIPAGATRMIGPFPVSAYNAAGVTTIDIDVSVSTNLKFRAYNYAT